MTKITIPDPVDEIAEMQPNRDIWEKVRARAEGGITTDRLIHQNEYIPIIRYLAFCERYMFALNRQSIDTQRRTTEGMGVISDPETRR